MQRNFILTDVMKTGEHQELHQFINLHSLQDQTFDLEYEYYSCLLYTSDAADE